MTLLKLLVISCCLVSLLLSYCAAATQGKKDTNTNTQLQSVIYKIKRLETTKDKLNMQQRLKIPQQQQQHQQTQQQPQQQTEGDTLPVATKPPSTKKVKNFTKTSHGLNKKLLSKLGFTKVKAPNSHNRKRLAIESRHHASPDDSHMFIIKLPPNFYYYTSPKDEGTGGALANSHNSLVPQTQTQTQTQTQLHFAAHGGAVMQLDAERDSEKILGANGKKVSFPFNSNGKPGRIYHWNLPVIKKMLEDKQRLSNNAGNKAIKQQLIDIKDIPTWTKPWENDTIEKSYGKSSMRSYKKSLKRKSPSYYAPANAVNKNSFNKYFSGNGKPKGFYVIKENQKKPLYYKNIVS